MIQIYNYKNTPIQFDVINGVVMANATAMCDLFKKRPNDFLNLSTTKKYMQAVTKKTGNDVNQLVKIMQGGQIQGTWIHQRLILKLAKWLSVDFEIWCDDKIAELIKHGNVSLETEKPEQFLLRHSNTVEQKRNSISVNAVNYIKGGVPQTIEYNQKSMLLHTGRYPNQWKKIAEKQGLKSKFRTSGKEALRNLQPELAIAMSISDEFVYSKGKRLEDVAPVSLQSVPLFKMLLDNGMIQLSKNI